MNGCRAAQAASQNPAYRPTRNRRRAPNSRCEFGARLLTASPRRVESLATGVGCGVVDEVAVGGDRRHRIEHSAGTATRAFGHALGEVGRRRTGRNPGRRGQDGQGDGDQQRPRDGSVRAHGVLRRRCVSDGSGGATVGAIGCARKAAQRAPEAILSTQPPNRRAIRGHPPEIGDRHHFRSHQNRKLGTGTIFAATIFESRPRGLVIKGPRDHGASR